MAIARHNKTLQNVQLITESTLRDLVAANALQALGVRAKEGGFEVVVKFGDAERVLGSSRGAGKVFASLDTVAVQLLRLGIESFTVNAVGYTPGRVRAARPDRSAALKQASKKNKKVPA